MYTLGAITLPTPKGFTRKFIETSAGNTTVGGKTTKKTQSRKEQFTLVFQELTQAQANAILSEYRLEEVRSFESTEAELTIAATNVLVDISPRNYPLSGKAYRENLTLILTEVE